MSASVGQEQSINFDARYSPAVARDDGWSRPCGGVFLFSFQSYAAAMAHDTIEIYVRNLSEDEAVTWLRSRFQDVERQPNALVETYVGTYDGETVPVQIAEGVENGPYTSLWFNAPETPWEGAEDCARSAQQGLGKEVLCFLNDPERPWTMLRVSEDGEEHVDKREVAL